MPTLVEAWVSRASAKQRRGRAGRVRPGIAYHMYSSHTHDNNALMQDYQLPEMLRVGLEDLVLQILVLDLGEPSAFLSKAVNPPSALAMKNSLKLLEGMGAIDVDWGESGASAPKMNKKQDSENTCATIVADTGLTALGFHLATLPLDPRVGKMVIYGALFGCTDAALTIAASMSARSPFFSPFDKRDQADEARQAFATEGSDPLTTLTAFREWKDMRLNHGEAATKAFLRDSFLSRQTLFQMEELRKQFAKLLVEIGFLPRSYKLNQPKHLSPTANANDDNVALIKAVLCAGLYPNVLVAPPSVLLGNGKQDVGQCAFRGLKGGEVYYLHPSTISFKAKKLDSRYCCYHEIVKTSKIYVRDCTTVSPFALLLFGGSLQVYHNYAQQQTAVVTVDGWLQFRIAAKPATLVKHLRAQMESLLLQKIIAPQEDATGSKQGQALIQAVSTLLDNERASAALAPRVPLMRPMTAGNNNVESFGSGRGAPQGNRGRGAPQDNRGRGGESQGRGGRGAPQDNRGRGGESQWRGRGGESQGRGRGTSQGRGGRGTGRGGRSSQGGGRGRSS
jgi:HrpA-like RNA helicase